MLVLHWEALSSKFAETPAWEEGKGIHPQIMEMFLAHPRRSVPLAGLDFERISWEDIKAISEIGNTASKAIRNCTCMMQALQAAPAAADTRRLFC